VPAFQISMSADLTRALDLRKRLVADTAEGQAKPTVTDVLTKICALALLRHRAVNARYSDEGIEIHPTANVGIAVATAKGLVVPVIPNCERRTLPEIAAARADVVGRAQQGKLQQADLEGGTFTISNLGMFGVEQFIAVLNPPQAAILAVGTIEERPVVRDGEIVARPMMTMTLTCDHRAVDGAVAAGFLQTVKDFLEEPGLTL
jgi:pyruvate dehydrogenase E2 component (dihydrolipoamide acetyltransferase)